MLCGIALNDADYKVTGCPFHQTWKRMVERCYAPSMLKRNPTYIDDTVCKDWLAFSNFKSWMKVQPWEGMELDKDMLVKGNKQYSPEACAFVPKKLNLLLSTSDGKRGDFALGVCLHSQARHKYQARSKIYLGLFDTEAAAHKAWQKQKSIDLFNGVMEWQFNPSISHTFNQEIAMNILGVSDRLLIECSMDLQTTSLKI